MAKKQMTQQRAASPKASRLAKLREEDPARGAGRDGGSAAVPEPEQIARLAYSYWEARGGQGGSPEEDWLRAERELRGLQ